MSNQQLRFNPKTMHYEVVQKKHSLWRNLLYVLFVGIAFGFLFVLIGIYFFKSSDVKKKEYDLKVYEKTYKENEEKYRKNIALLRELEMYDHEIFKDIFEANVVDSTLLSDKLITEADAMKKDINFTDFLPTLTEKYKNIAKAAKMGIVRLKYANFFIKHNSGLLKTLPIRIPLKEGTYSLVSGFGKRIHPIFKTTRQHNGLDFVARAGTDVFATADGIVQKAPGNFTGYGTIVFINHNNGYCSIYAQLLEQKVGVGQSVKAGDVIGSVGSTGISIGTHLHYEIWKNGKPVDPMKFILTVPPIKYVEMLKIASQYNQCLS